MLCQPLDPTPAHTASTLAISPVHQQIKDGIPPKVNTDPSLLLQSSFSNYIHRSLHVPPVTNRASTLPTLCQLPRNSRVLDKLAAFMVTVGDTRRQQSVPTGCHGLRRRRRSRCHEWRLGSQDFWQTTILISSW